MSVTLEGYRGPAILSLDDALLRPKTAKLNCITSMWQTHPWHRRDGASSQVCPARRRWLTGSPDGTSDHDIPRTPGSSTIGTLTRPRWDGIQAIDEQGASLERDIGWRLGPGLPLSLRSESFKAATASQPHLRQGTPQFCCSSVCRSRELAFDRGSSCSPSSQQKLREKLVLSAALRRMNSPKSRLYHPLSGPARPGSSIVGCFVAIE